LESIAARLQEWTGAQGGVIFSERVSLDLDDKTWSVVLCLSVRDAGLIEAIGAEINRNQSNFRIDIVAHGQLLGVDPDDPTDAAQTTRQILKPFLD
jgi:hypothetical protein